MTTLEEMSAEIDALKKQIRAGYDADVLGINELRRRTASMRERIENLESWMRIQPADEHPEAPALKTIDASLERSRIRGIAEDLLSQCRERARRDSSYLGDCAALMKLLARIGGP